MSDLQIFPHLITLLNKDFPQIENSLPACKNYAEELEKLRGFLAERISILMENDFDKFVNSLYRMDINENKVRSVFTNKDDVNLNYKIADLIIERQLQRAHTRMMYKEGKL